jgi:periplasmic divalent cation tolerance protein
MRRERVADVVQVSTTTDNRDEADRLARTLVEARLAACAQVGGPVTSTYWWEGRVETATEQLVVLKTTADLVDALVERLRRLHSYDVPEIVVTPVTGGNPAYLDWVAAESRGAGAGGG